jgi:hypothetical protein
LFVWLVVLRQLDVGVLLNLEQLAEQLLDLNLKFFQFHQVLHLVLEHIGLV